MMLIHSVTQDVAGGLDPLCPSSHHHRHRRPHHCCSYNHRCSYNHHRPAIPSFAAVDAPPRPDPSGPPAWATGMLRWEKSEKSKGKGKGRGVEKDPDLIDYTSSEDDVRSPDTEN